MKKREVIMAGKIDRLPKNSVIFMDMQWGGATCRPIIKARKNLKINAVTPIDDLSSL